MLFRNKSNKNLPDYGVVQILDVNLVNKAEEDGANVDLDS